MGNVDDQVNLRLHLDVIKKINDLRSIMDWIDLNFLYWEFWMIGFGKLE